MTKLTETAQIIISDRSCDRTAIGKELLKGIEELEQIAADERTVRGFITDELRRANKELDKYKQVVEAAKKHFEASESPFYEGMKVLIKLKVE